MYFCEQVEQHNDSYPLTMVVSSLGGWLDCVREPDGPATILANKIGSLAEAKWTHSLRSTSLRVSPSQR